MREDHLLLENDLVLLEDVLNAIMSFFHMSECHVRLELHRHRILGLTLVHVLVSLGL